MQCQSCHQVLRSQGRSRSGERVEAVEADAHERRNTIAVPTASEERLESASAGKDQVDSLKARDEQLCKWASSGICRATHILRDGVEVYAIEIRSR